MCILTADCIKRSDFFASPAPYPCPFVMWWLLVLQLLGANSFPNPWTSWLDLLRLGTGQQVGGVMMSQSREDQVSRGSAYFLGKCWTSWHRRWDRWHQVGLPAAHHVVSTQPGSARAAHPQRSSLNGFSLCPYWGFMGFEHRQADSVTFIFLWGLFHTTQGSLASRLAGRSASVLWMAEHITPNRPYILKSHLTIRFVISDLRDISASDIANLWKDRWGYFSASQTNLWNIFPVQRKFPFMPT